MSRNSFTRNPMSVLYRRLTKMFSGPIVDYKRQTPSALKRRQLKKHKFYSADGTEFKKNAYNPFANVQLEYMANQDRLARYADYRQMEFLPELGSALDIYADEMTTFSPLEPLLRVECPNEEIKVVLLSLFYDTLNIEHNLFHWTRATCKYGDFFLYLDVDENEGVKNVIGLPEGEVERLEGQDESNPNYVQFQWNTQGATFENWQVAHFRNLGNDKFVPYGTCHKFDTRVWTVDGVKEIQDINIGDKVYSFDLESQKKIETKVLDVVESGEKECFKIQTKHSYLESSKEHRILVFSKDSGFMYKNVKDLVVGELLTLNKEHNVNNKIRIDKKKPDGKNYNGYWNSVDKVPDYVDEDFARLVGFLIGDGWINSCNDCVSFAIGVHDELNKLYTNLLEKYTGKRGRIRNDNNQIGFSSKMFATVLKRMGFAGNVYTKRIPDWVFSSSVEIKKSFIKGLIDADGSLHIDKWNCLRYQIELANEQLIKDFKVLLQTVGYKTGKICSRKRTGPCFIEGREIKNIKESFYFYFFESKLEQYKKHDNVYRNSNEYVLEPIISIEKSGVFKTYDIYVENENHNFIANNIVTHNSVLDSARRIWKQLILLEDAMMAYRIVRAPDRRVFYIDVGNIEAKDVEQYMQKVQTQMKRNQVINSETGRVDLRYNPLSIEEDIYIPMRGPVGSKVENLPGGQYTGDIDDVKYLRDKLFSAIKIPQAYLSQEGGGNEDKTSLSQKDILFAKTVQRLQLAIIAELTKIATIHLFSVGYRQSDLVNFELVLNNPSKISEMQHLEEWRTRFDIASSANDMFSSRWIAKKIFKLSEEEIVKNTRERFYDAKLAAELEAIATAGEGGMGEEGLMGGEDLGMGDEDLGIGDEEEEIPGIETGDEEAVPAGEEETLLAAPAKRDEDVFVRMPKSKVKPGQKWTGSLKSKGKMNTKGTTDKRKGFAPRQKDMKTDAEKARSSKRNLFPGADGMSRLAVGLREEKILEENKIFSLNNELKQIIKELEKKKNEKEEDKEQT